MDEKLLPTDIPQRHRQKMWIADRETTKNRRRIMKYHKGEKLWIQSRKLVYLYWYKFLQHAERDPERTVDWSKYKGWGGAKVVLNTKFDDWWNERWVNLFGIKKEGDLPKFPLASRNPNYQAIRYSLMVYESSLLGLKNWDIALRIEKYEHWRKRPSRVFAYANPDYLKSIKDKVTSNADVAEVLHQELKDRKMETQSKVGRLKRLAIKRLDDVCKGQFP